MPILRSEKAWMGSKKPVAQCPCHDQLRTHLAPYGYAPVRFTPGLWWHDKCRTTFATFTLAVDDFGIKYYHLSDLEHLFNALGSKYILTKDLSGAQALATLASP